jgi:nucleoside-diphosphate-sugar epimerase
MKTVAITGASGFLGQELINRFITTGWQVLALSRTKPTIVSKNLKWVPYDMNKPIPKETVKGISCLVHAAVCKVGTVNDEVYEVNMTAARNIKKLRLRKVIFVSSMSVQPDAVSVYARQKRDIEELLKGPNCVVLRFGLIVGNGGIVGDMVSMASRTRIVPIIDGGNQPLQVISLEDAALAVQNAAESKQSGCFILAYPKVYSYRQLYKVIFSTLRLRVVYVPVRSNLLCSVLRAVRFVGINLKFSEDNIRSLPTLRSYETEANLQEFGIKEKHLEDILIQYQARQ